MIFHRDENTDRFGLFSNSINVDRAVVIGFVMLWLFGTVVLMVWK